MAFSTVSKCVADTCFELFLQHGSGMEPLQCADNSYAANSEDFSVFIDLAEAASGQFSATHDGLTIFGGADPNNARPASLLAPFSSSTNVTATGDASGVTAISIAHEGEIASMARNIAFQSASFETKSRVAFSPVKTGSPGASVPLTIQLAGIFLLQDNTGGGSTGAALAGAQFEVRRISGVGPSFSGGTDFDLSINPMPNLFGDFAGSTSVSPAGAGRFSIAVQHSMTINVAEGETMAVDSATNGNIFTDGFESGDTSIWRAATSTPLVFTISSTDPNVRFEVIPETPPSGGGGLARIVDWRQVARTDDDVTLRIEWISAPDANYGIDFSRDGRTWVPMPGSENVPSEGARTFRQLEVDIGAEPNALVRVREL